MKRLMLIFICLACFGATATAKTVSGFQGDVLRLEIPAGAPADVAVEAFGKRWPVYSYQGKHIAWVGIHLYTLPDSYPLTWMAGTQKWHDMIAVKKGDFRISHIQVEKKMATFDEESLKRIKADQQAIKNAYHTPVSTKNSWPAMIEPAQGAISTPFAAQRYVNGKPRSPHSGIDIAAVEGTPVHAPLAGTVLLVSDMYLNGNLVAIGHGDGLTTVYAHLKRALVKQGDILKQGDVFAEVGSSGRSTGPHLHWGVHFAGAKVNPESMLHKEPHPSH